MDGSKLELTQTWANKGLSLAKRNEDGTLGILTQQPNNLKEQVLNAAAALAKESWHDGLPGTILLPDGGELIYYPPAADIDDQFERKYKVERYLLTNPQHDPFQLRVINSVNLPNNPEFEDLVEEWIINNYGNLDGWDYYCLSRTKMRTIGLVTDEQSTSS